MRKNKQHSFLSARQWSWMMPVSVLLTIAQPAMADTVPDAGRVLREQPKAPPPLTRTPKQLAPAGSAEPAPVDSGATVLVKDFSIQGATLISAAELKSKISGVIGKELTFMQLRAVAESLVAYYAQKGYLAQAVLPQQDIENGVIQIDIIEGKRGSLLIKNTGKRTKSERIQGVVDYRLAEGERMSLEGLGTAVNILNEQPGIKAKSTLKPGAQTGYTDLILTVEEKPLATFTAGVNNEGSRGTGEARAFAGVTLNNPTGRFDQANLLFTKTEGSEFGIGQYSLALGDSGFRLGASVSHVNYEVTQDSLRAIKAHGRATTVGLNALYPLYRLNEFSLSLVGNVDTKKLKDYTIAGNTGDRRVDTVTFGVDGKRLDTLAGGGETSFGVAYLAGHSNEDNQDVIANDKVTRQALGNFSKLKYNLLRQQKINDTWLVTANMRGQFSFDNQDSTERFYLGGADRVRAYPTGEASGDDGWALSLNLIHLFSEALQGSVFYDIGSVRVNHDTWAGWNASNPRLDNRYSLKGAGASLDWKLNDNFALSGVLASPIGKNPGRDDQGNDSDARSLNLRAWLGLVGQF